MMQIPSLVAVIALVSLVLWVALASVNGLALDPGQTLALVAIVGLTAILVRQLVNKWREGRKRDR